MRRAGLRWLLVVALLGSLFVFIGSAWLVGLEGGDRCATANVTPPTAEGSRMERSRLPWRWTCVYRLRDGGEVRQTRVLWDGGGPGEPPDDDSR